MENSPNPQSPTSDKKSQDAMGLKANAEDLKTTAQSAVADQATTYKDTAANEIDSIASAFRKAADELQDDSPQARTFKQFSTGLAEFSETVRGKDFAEMTRDVSNFARRNPAVFLGASVLVGLMASRFAKASDSHSSQPSTRTDSDNTDSPVPRSPRSGLQPNDRSNVPGQAPLPGGPI